MKNNSYYCFFKNLANRTNMKIISVLTKRPLTVKEIINKTGIEQSNVSHSLRKLKACKILYSNRHGKYNVYSLNEETIIPILKLVNTHAKKNCRGECLCKKI